MKILIAIDSFKGCLTSYEAGHAVKESIKELNNDAEVEVFSVSDGGEGLTEALLANKEYELRTLNVTGPLGNIIEASYGIYQRDGKKTAVVEMAAAAGLTLVHMEKRNPLYTTTYGVGEMILDAVKQGCRSFIIGIGGSATNDAGIGMLQALGYGFYDKSKMVVPFGAIAVRDTEIISDKDVNEALRECEFRVVCDVKNPLYGENGCSMIFSPQKGASTEQAVEMDDWFVHYASVVKIHFPGSDAYAEGSGAAGGLGFAFRTFLNAKLERGIETILKENGFMEFIPKADLVITGEGRIDSQTAMGKVPAGVAELAKKYGIKVIAFGGSVDENAKDVLKQIGIDECYEITPKEMPLETAMRKDVAIENLKKMVYEKSSAQNYI